MCVVPAAEHGQQPVHSYILAPQGLAPGDSITSGSGAAIRPGNTMPLKVRAGSACWT